MHSAATMKLGSSPICSWSGCFPLHHQSRKNSRFLPKLDHGDRNYGLSSGPSRGVPYAVGDGHGHGHGQRSSLESLFCYDKPIPEEIIEKPVGISLAEKNVDGYPRCPNCEAKGAVLCTTCAGSGLYIDSILESQGIIVKVRCLGCGGTGNTMCSDCGGRGHI